MSGDAFPDEKKVKSYVSHLKSQHKNSADNI